MKWKFASVIAMSSLLLAGCGTQVKLEPKQEMFTVEYGKAISLKAESYFKNNEKELEKISTDTKISNEKNKKYPAVGEYTLTFVYDGNTKKKTDVKVKVKDTTSPKFEDIQKEYVLDYGSKLTTDKFQAKDLSAVEVTLDESKIDYNKAGTYTATIIAKDKFGNETKEEVTVVIKDKPQEPSPNTNTNDGNDYYEEPSYNDESSSGGTAWTPDPLPAPPVCNYDIGNSGMLFDTEAEAIAWAEQVCFEDGFETYSGFVYWSTCGKYTVGFKYR